MAVKSDVFLMYSLHEFSFEDAIDSLKQIYVIQKEQRNIHSIHAIMSRLCFFRRYRIRKNIH